MLLPGGRQSFGEMRQAERLVSHDGGSFGVCEGGRGQFSCCTCGSAVSVVALGVVSLVVQRADVLAERYLQLLANAKVKGYLFEQQNYWSKENQQQ